MEEFNRQMDIDNVDEFEEVEKMNFIQRVVGIIFAPTKTMKNLINKPRIIFPIFLVTLSTLILYILLYDKLHEYMRITMENAKSLQENNPAYTPEMINTTIKWGTRMAVASAPIWRVIGWIGGTAIYFGFIKLLLNGKGKFSQYLSITGYANVITTLSLVVVLIVSLTTDKFDPKLVVTSLGSLVSEESVGKILYAVLNKIELFTIWYYAIIGIGFSLVSKVNKKFVYIIIGGCFLAQIILVISSTAISSMFTH
ncbi:MAG: YIP1 family protein [Bacillota bacterium]|nr:YIP1 family protein [Bacillota bacterium]